MGLLMSLLLLIHCDWEGARKVVSDFSHHAKTLGLAFALDLPPHL